MTTHHGIVVALAIGLIVAMGPAQEIAGVVTQTGPTQMTLTVTAGPNGVTLQTVCVFMTVHLYRPDGPVIAALPCAAQLTPIAPCAQRFQTFTPPVVSYGTLYYFGVYTYDFLGSPHADFFPGWLAPSGGTSFTALTPAQIGTTLVLQLSDPTLALHPYMMALSATTNTGISLSPSTFISLDPDAIFFFSFPNPDPVYLTNFQGSLDASGVATATVHLPYVPALACRPLHAQAVILTGGAIASLSLPLSFAILP